VQSASNETLSLPLIIEVEALERVLSNPEKPSLIIVDLSKAETHRQVHIEGAVYINPAEIVLGEKPVPGKLPNIETLQAIFDRIGYHPDAHIVAYDDEGGGWAGRFIWTLDMIGHKHYSYLNGGLHAWLGAKMPVTKLPTAAVNQPRPYTISFCGDRNVSMAEVLSSLEDKNTIIWDARSHEEHVGSRLASRRGGRIPGAINFDWLDAMDRDRQLRIHTDIQSRLASVGIDGSKPIITHCQSHHRSGLTYLIGKSLGFDIKAYDGSWSEWGNNPDTPIETG